MKEREASEEMRSVQKEETISVHQEAKEEKENREDFQEKEITINRHSDHLTRIESVADLEKDARKDQEDNLVLLVKENQMNFQDVQNSDEIHEEEVESVQALVAEIEKKITHHQRIITSQQSLIYQVKATV
jgi:hypothetical protein